MRFHKLPRYKLWLLQAIAVKERKLWLQEVEQQEKDSPVSILQDQDQIEVTLSIAPLGS